ncbi:uncharacterized protein LOC123321583 isoform X1 [Coccinella septempunctata]|uniref:uncharacterized protein LOC123321583 isoform X1 n=1 Tax=Coccinella septempunctata TaxID=41139 RepID=UPI001D08C7AE|nr:uncharacterized protein LOC123321583 isoform X1 [Coccinella septempunctata]
MYKSLKNISKRHKRRLKQKAVEKIYEGISVNSSIATSPLDTTDNNISCELLPGPSRTCTETSTDENILHMASDVDDSQNILLDYSSDDDDNNSSDCESQNNSFNVLNFESDKNESVEMKQNKCLEKDIREWAINYNIRHRALSSLLSVLNKNNICVPFDARTLLKTPRTVAIDKMEPGEYCHFELKQGILNSLDKYVDIDNVPSELGIDVNIDGLPLSKSSGSQFWPILGAIVLDGSYTHPFPIGIYHGTSKPACVNDFLKKFVDEARVIIENGVIWKTHKIEIKFNAFICDAPARALILGVKNHTGYFGCTKCIQEGDFINNRMTFPEIESTLRTNESFRNKLQEEHHRELSILETLDIDMVSQIPVEYMHLVCLGVMKRLLQFGCKGKMNVRIPSVLARNVDADIMKISAYIPQEFCRKPRPLTDVERFKATEFRLFLLYVGPIIFKNKLDIELYNHFLHLFCAIRILATPHLCYDLNDYAGNLLKIFVRNYGNLYGEEYLTYNVHNLLHLCDDVKRFGWLDKYSAFKFENFMYSLKKKLCLSSGKPLQQIAKRLHELSDQTTHHEKVRKIPFIVPHRNKKLLNFENFILSNAMPDNCCLLKSKEFVLIDDINLNQEKYLLEGHKLQQVGEGLFTLPLDSRSLGIHVVEKSNEIVKFSEVDILCKIVLIPWSDKFVSFPLIHSNGK